MIVRAPGKLLLSGAYAVLRGAPALSIAVSRYAYADARVRNHNPTLEVKAAIPNGPWPMVNNAELNLSGQKLGLGSSSAGLVASLAALLHIRGNDLLGDDARRAILRSAFDAHRTAQGGGSGVDVATSIYGGLVEYRLSNDAPSVRSRAWPEHLIFRCYFSGRSARTSEFLTRVATFFAARKEEASTWFDRLGAQAEACVCAVDDGARSLVLAVDEYASLLRSFGRAADIAIATPEVEELARQARDEGGSFFMSGAGGGDCALYVGERQPGRAFVEAIIKCGFTEVGVEIDRSGVQAASYGGRQ